MFQGATLYQWKRKSFFYYESVKDDSEVGVAIRLNAIDDCDRVTVAQKVAHSIPAGQGHDVKIINYKPDYLSGHFSLAAVNNSIFDKPIIKQLYLLAKHPQRLIALSRKKEFDAFTAKYLHLTRRYNSYEEIRANAPEADVYIAGSDQIWNTLLKNGRDRVSYLDFGDKKIKRISYAASFATPDIVPEYREFVGKELHNLDACSIREKTSLALLTSLGRDT